MAMATCSVPCACKCYNKHGQHAFAPAARSEDHCRVACKRLLELRGQHARGGLPAAGGVFLVVEVGGLVVHIPGRLARAVPANTIFKTGTRR